MSVRVVMIESPVHLTAKSSQLHFHTDRDITLPIEDLDALLLESRQSTISTAALSQLGQSGCAVFICDEKHLPCAVLTPFVQHSRALQVLQLQLQASEPLKKRLWQSLVCAKILNQSLCLQELGYQKDAEILSAMRTRVRSGDPDNVEAAAAQKYFRALYGKAFTRNTDCPQNAALNYGYAVLRGSMARFLSAYGFLPAMGLHHRNMLNSFNLADDFMEAFRPVVDLLVSACVTADDSLTPAIKRQLFNVLNLDILSGESHHSVSYAMERLVQSFARSLQEKRANLCLPKLLPLQQHQYE